jgi:hypothetical protein
MIMLPEITRELIIQYIILIAIILPTTLLVFIYHFYLFKNTPQSTKDNASKNISNDDYVKTENVSKEITKLYKELKLKYNLAKSGDKKTRLKNKKTLEKIEQAYKEKNYDFLISL